MAGDVNFVRPCLGSGVDEARARFARYARKVSEIRPGLAEISAEYQPRRVAWKHPAEVAPESNTVIQIGLMKRFVAGEISAVAFTRSWLAARHDSLMAGERTREHVEHALNMVFYALDDYTPDPSLRDPGDLDDAQLTSIVSDALIRLESLNSP